MSGLTAFLQTELLTLSSEARRKHPEIKEVCVLSMPTSLREGLLSHHVGS